MLARLTVLVLLLFACAVPLRAAAPTEYQVMAGLLLKFAKFATWPQAALPDDAQFNICVLGRDPFGNDLAGLESHQVKGHPVRVLRPESVESARSCKVLFVASSEQRRLNAILRELAGAPILTISDIEGFVEAGGGIGLFTEDDRVRFDVNFGSLARNGVRLDSQVLDLARRVLGLGTP